MDKRDATLPMFPTAARVAQTRNVPASHVYAVCEKSDKKSSLHTLYARESSLRALLGNLVE